MNGQGYFPGSYYNPQRPMYQTYFPQQDTPYFQQQSQFENQNFPGGINGKIISNPNEITPQDVAMNGGMCIFPMMDYSVIYAKQWTPDGKIRTIEFVPKDACKEEPKDAKDPEANIIECINERFAALDKAIACVMGQIHDLDVQKPSTEKSTTRRS